MATRGRWAVAAAGVVVVLAAVVWVVPRLLYPPLPASRFAGVAPDRRIELETNRLKLQSDARATLAQILAGGILLVGAYLTWRQLGVNREGQITERYTRAIDQLGHAQLDVRLGGIYALERIARDSPADRATIREVLTAFIRGHAPWPPRLPGQDMATASIEEIPELPVRAADVQASLTVLGRSGFAPPWEAQGDRLDLHSVDLRHAQLDHAHLEGASLGGAHLEQASLGHAHLNGARLIDAHLNGAILIDAHLEQAILDGAHLERTYLGGAHLNGASLGGAHLEGASLGGAHLEGASLGGAHLEGASLGGAHLEGAYLRGAHLEGANLRGAHLEGAYLGGAHLNGANLGGAHLEEANLGGAYLEQASLYRASLKRTVADSHTSWPAGFDWRAAGVRSRSHG